MKGLELDYTELERTISNYNELVNTLNKLMDGISADNKVENAPFEAFELIKTTDENENHLPYLYLRFVYLPYHVDQVEKETSKSESFEG